MKLLIEELDNVEVLTEATSDGKKLYLEGRFLQGGRKGIKEDKNGNGRIYEEHVLDNAVKKYTPSITNKTALGELSHPTTPQINPDRVCLVLEHLTKDGIHYNGKARISTKTPCGAIVEGILDAGGKLGVSSRALGSTYNHNGIIHVNDDLNISAIDTVTNPSGVGCFSNVVLESLQDTDWQILEDGTILQLNREVLKHKISEDKAIRIFADLMLSYAKGKK